MLQPKKDNFKLNQSDQSILEKEMINYANEGASDEDLIEFKNTFISEKKKAIPQSVATATPPKLGSGTSTGSSGGVNPAFKSTIPSPIPDFNSMKSVKSEKKPLQKPAILDDKKETSFYDYLKENLSTGLATVSKSVYDAPGLIYDAAASITNIPFRLAGVPEDQLASSDKLADDLGFKNVPSEILKEKIKVSNEKINAYAAKNGGDAWQAATDGNYGNAAKLVAGTTMQSLPIMVAAMASGGQSSALTAIGVSTASTKNAQLKEENPEMDLGTRVANSANAGIIEAVTGHLFTGASGAVMKKILAEKGVEQGSKIIAKSFKSTIEKSIEKNPLVGAFGEIVEESAVEFGNQLNDMSSGIRTEFDFHAIKNAGLSATGMGGIQTLGVYGAKGYVKAKEYAKMKAVNKEVFKLRNEIETGNLSDENKALLSIRADRLEAENKKLLGSEIEKAKSLPADAKTELNILNAEFEDLKSKFDDIESDPDIPSGLKKSMAEEIKIQANANQKRKTEILSQNDGLEIDTDFSKFDGVEPDFNLENGKISSLPLKEQERLNKLAVEKITGGDKTIEYTKEQVSETANEIYKNEQNPTTPTPEAQPQTEVQKPSEAEKVDEPISEEQKMQFGAGYKDYDFKKENVSINKIKITEQPSLSEKQELIDDIKNNGIKEPIVVEYDKESDSYYVKNGNHRAAIAKELGIKEIPTIVAEYKDTKNEATPPTNPPADGNIQSGTSNVGEVRATEQEIPAKESVPSSVDGGEVKGDVEVSDLDHAKDQIKKGVLLWNGDAGAERVNLGIPWADIRKGEADIKRGKPDTVPAKRLIEALKTAKEKGGYEYVQGRGGQNHKQFVTLDEIQRSNNEYELTDAEQKEVDAHEVELAKEYEAYFEALDVQTQNDIYENKEGINGLGEEATPSGESKNDVSNQEKPKTSTTKEKIAERIKLSDAKIDATADAVKAKMKAFAAMFPSADINPEDYHTNGFSMDAIIDMVAKAAKSIAKGGIVTSEHIKEAISAYNQHFDDKIDPKSVAEKINPKKEEKEEPKNESFEAKAGKKSVLNRAFEGGNSEAITDTIEKHGLDYRIENQEEAKQRAEDFVNEVGPASALEAVRNNQIKGAEKAFVYSTIIDNLLKEIESTNDPIAKEQLEAEHAKIIADITNELSQEGTDAGRFISALNKVYNSSKLRYNLKSQIDAHKASNNGQISDEVLEKFTQADKRIKELEKLIEEAEAKAQKAEEELSIKNIQEDIERKKQLANKNKSGLTPKEQTRKKELKTKFFGRLNDATGLITMLADPEFREYLGLTFKQAKGDFENFSKRVLSELGKGAKSHLPQLFEEGQKSTPANSKQITIGKSGKLSIPAQLFRDYVEAGETDIDVIAAKIKEDIADEFPDVDIRDIRDAITGYGKQINPTKDEVSIEISRLKRLGKLISAYEDASNGISPLKSGLKQPKPTQEMRDLKKEINRLIKENGLDAVDLEKQWASALDKVKSQLKNQIEDLDKQIANGEKRKVERTTTVLDEEATALKAIRDAKKQLLDDMVGKPELSEEQLIARAEKSLETSIEKLQKEIAEGQLEYKEKPTVKQSKKLDELRKQRKELVETKNQLREEAGLVEAQRLKTAKKRVRNQIEDLKQKIADKDYSKKEPKPLIEDGELAQLRAEKLRQQEVYDAQKYADELRNRSTFQKWTDALLELWNVPRILKATGELSTVLIQGGILTTSRKLTNPKALGKIMKELLISLGSAKKAAKYEALIKASPEYALAIKSGLALTNPDYKSDVREEQYSGDYANLFWDLPFVLASYNSRASEVISKERTVFGDVLKKVTGIGTPGTDKLSIRQQWKNVNPFVALERGGTLYMNTLRMEEFIRGAEMLRMEGKNEVDHLQDYKLLANAINSMSGRANLPTSVASSSKALAAVFFSARNAVSIVNQVNPVYYGYLHFGSSDGFQMKKTSVANKLAVTNMMRFVTITGMTMLAIKAAAGKDEDDEDIVQIETDPNSSDFMKMRIGDIRFDPWHGLTTMIVLMSRFFTEEVKSTSTGETTKLGEKRFGPQSRLDLIGAWGRNKFAPSMAITANYLATHEEVDPSTNEAYRETPFGERFADDESLDMTPMYWSAVKEIQKEDPGAMAEFLTVVSVFGWNTSVYKKSDSKSKGSPFMPKMPSMPTPPSPK